MTLGTDIIIVPRVIAGLGFMMFGGIILLTVKDNRRPIGRYFLHKLALTFEFVPWRYSLNVARFGIGLYSRIFRFVRSWDFWLASVTGRVDQLPAFVSDSMLPIPVAYGVGTGQLQRQTSVIHGKR